MSRSVSVPGDAMVVCYQNVSHIEESWEWDDYIEDLQLRVGQLWPSLLPVSDWVGRELHVVARSDHASVVLAVYCGLASISLVPNPSSGLGRSWCRRVAGKFTKTFGQLRLIGTASNGEAFFEGVRQ